MPGERAVQTTLLQTSELGSAITGHADREIKPILERNLEEERHLHNPVAGGILAEHAPRDLKEAGMRKILQPKSFRIIREYDPGERRPVHKAGRLEDSVAVAAP